MYKGLQAAISKTVTDPRVIELGSATIYREENGFSYAANVPGEARVDRGNEFIKIVIANDESFSWLPLNDEARDNRTYLSALINGEITGTD